VFICVPTPLLEGTPDLSFIDRACAEVATRLAAGSLVVLESTTYPGTTDERVKPLLEASGLVAGHDLASAAEVAGWGYRAAKAGTPFAVYGARWKAFAFGTRLMPRTVAARVAMRAQERVER
jgi:UDP-N-acetyl-D-mannosaminuronic acid dehydrogenase/UDP-N-acetyl-D-glucosamine dehydrogenase